MIEIAIGNAHMVVAEAEVEVVVVVVVEDRTGVELARTGTRIGIEASKTADGAGRKLAA